MMSRNTLAFAAAIMVLLTGGCSQSPAAPSRAPTPTPPPAARAPLQGTWNGSMTDWIGTAQSRLTVQADGSNDFAYRYAGRPASYAWYDVAEGGRITIRAFDPGHTVSFRFLSPNLGTQGPYCWDGDFQGTLTSDESGKETLAGTYELRGWSEDCFSPPRTGTFSLVRDMDQQ